MADCERCLTEINDKAVKCTHCGSYQGWRHIFAWYVPAASGVLATVLGLPALYGIYNGLIEEQSSNVRLLSAFFENDQLSTHLINLGERPALIARQMTCLEKGQKEFPIQLSIFGNERSSDAQLSEILMFHGQSEPTRIDWNVWNAEIEDVDLPELGPEDKSRILEHLEGIVAEEYASESEKESELASKTVETLGRSIYLPMMKTSSYHLSISARLLEYGLREAKDEYEFTCWITGKDELGTIEQPSLELSFLAGGYSADRVGQPFQSK